MNLKICRRLVGASLCLTSIAGMAGLAEASGDLIDVADAGITGNPCPISGTFEQVAAFPSGATVLYAKPSSIGQCLIGTQRYRVTASGTAHATDLLYHQEGSAGGTLHLRLKVGT